jgi:hypothetical protein
MTLVEAAVNAFTAGVLGVIILCLYRVVLWARRRAKRAYIIGAALAPFIAMGNVSDPEFRIVNEAKQDKKREEDLPGDPPCPASAAALEYPPNKASLRQRRAKRRTMETIMSARKVTRPTASWAIAVFLGITAIFTSLAQSLILFADPADLAPRAREVLATFTVFEWASLYLLHAMLLTSMFMLFRLRKSSVWLFATYSSLGVSLSVWYAMRGEPIVPVGVTALGAAVAVLVLTYMLRLKRQGRLA